MIILTKKFLAVAVLASLGVGSVHASTVDLFTDPDPAQNVRDTTASQTQAGFQAVGANTCASGTISGTGCFSESGTFSTILGGYRDVYVNTVLKQFGGSMGTEVSAGEGTFSYSSGSGIDGYAKVQWDGQDNSADLATTGLNSANLKFQDGCGTDGCDRFVATVLQADFGFEYKITVFDMDGSGATLTANTLFAVNNATGADYAFDWFNLAAGDYFLGGLPFNIAQIAGGTTAGIDFTKIGALQFEVNTSGVFNLDLTLDSITKVPEPTALALVGVALLGLAVTTRRRRLGSKD
jgi:hypothetical protein